jgi:hypothetical protein
MINLEETKDIYEMEHQAITNSLCTYERLVMADVTVSKITSEIERDIDYMRCAIGIDNGIEPDGKTTSVAKLEWIFKNETVELRHWLRIFQSLYSTIKSKQFKETRY